MAAVWLAAFAGALHVLDRWRDRTEAKTREAATIAEGTR